MKIHAIQTGTVMIKRRQMVGVGRAGRRQLNMLLDRAWTEPLPIYAYAIEHPEGVIVVDTGESARASDPGYFRRWHPYFRYGVRLFVEPEHLPGHTPGHMGVVVQDGDHNVLIAGDASYNQELMLRGAVDGVSPDEPQARLTLERIRALAPETPTVYLVAHDPETAARLSQRRVIDPAAVSSPPG